MLVINKKLDEILASLKRVEDRQLGFKETVEERKQGSFGSIDKGEEN